MNSPPNAIIPFPTAARLGAEVIESNVLSVSSLPPAAQADLCRRLTIPNPKFAEAIQYARSTWNVPRELIYYARADLGELITPRGALPLVEAVAADHGVPLWVTQDTCLLDPIDVTLHATLTPAQSRAVERALQRPMGLLVAPAGAGKTVMGLAAVALRRQPTLWLTHTRELAAQTRERAIEILGLDPGEIGTIGGGKRTIGERLTIAMVQTLARGFPPGLTERIGQVIVDECHHTPAQQMAAAVSRFPAHYLLGLSATPYRRDRLDRVIEFYLGPVTAELAPEDCPDRLIVPRVIRCNTGLSFDGSDFASIVSALVVDEERNELIRARVVECVLRNRTCLVLTERVEHAEQLGDALIASCLSAAVLHGGSPAAWREEIREQVAGGSVTALVATGQLIGEGFDVPRLDTLILATPVSYRGRLIQYLGRVSRTAPGKTDALVIDFADDCPMLWSQWRNRRRTYEQLGCEVTVE